jgi:CRP-like cAMP-binding protein
MILVFVGALAAPAFYLGISLVRKKHRPTKKEAVLSFEEQIEALQRIPMFSILNDQERLNLFNEMEVAFFEHGQELVAQGEIGKEFLVLVRGEAKVFYMDHHGQEHELAGLASGDAFGEIALIDDVPRTASVVAQGPCHVLVLKKLAFTQFVNTIGSPERAKQMIRLSTFFRRHPLFNKLDAKSQADLIDTLQFHTIMPGEEVSINVDGQDYFYVVYAGNVRVDSGDDNGDLRLGQDDCFGYANPFQNKFVAEEGVGLLAIKIHEFHELVWNKLIAYPELFLNTER